MKTNKFVSLFIVFTLLISSLGYTATAAQEQDENIAYAIFGEKLKSSNFQSVRVGAQADVKQVSERNGEPCWIIDKANGLQSDKICMVFDNKFKSGIDDGDAFEVEVDYFDVESNGFFILAYDGQRPRQQNESYSRADEKIVYTQGSKKWKTAKFRIDDAKFNKNLEGGCDMYVGTRQSDALNNADYLSEIPIPFKQIRVKKIPKANPIRNIVSIDNSGNAFAWYDENKIIHNSFTNLWDKEFTADVTFEFENADGYVAYSKTEEMTFGEDEQKKFDFDFSDFKRCDRYKYVVSVKDDELGINSRVTYSIIAILKTDPDGIKNEHMNMCGPLYANNSATSIENIYKALDVFELGGFSGIRYDEGWNNRETTLGGFNTGTKQDVFVGEVEKRGLDVLPILFYGNSLVTGGWNRFAETPEQLERMSKFTEKLINHLKDKTDYYEAWNEPDLRSFSVNFSPENYMNTYSVVAESLRKNDPNAKIGYLCYASGNGGLQHDWTTQMLDLGLGEMIRGNAITFHGYPNPNAEEHRTQDKIQWYVDELKKYGVNRNEYEVWITEYGGTVADKHIGTRKRQGAVTVRETLMTRIEQNVDRFYIYRFEDPGNLIYRREASFGHVSSANGYARIYGQICVPWESYIMVTAYNYLFANSKPVGYVVNKDNLKGYKFKSDKFGKDIISLNSVKGVETVTFDLGVNELSFFDEYGNEEILKSNDGIYTFNVTEYPHYLMGNFTKNTVLENSDKFVVDSNVEAVLNDSVNVEITNNTDNEYRVELEMPLVNNDMSEIVLKPGKNTFAFVNHADDGAEYEVRLNVKDNSGTVSIIPLEIRSVPAAVTQMYLQLKNPSNFNKWQGVARISNSSDSKVLSGKFEVLSPEQYKTKKPVDVTFVPRHVTAEVVFDLPEITQKQIYTFEYKLTLDTGEIIYGDTKADTTCAAYAVNKPVIDGKIEDGEWNMQTLMQTSKLENVVYNGGWDGKLWQGPSDQSAKAYAMWDEENVYFCWDVTDDIFSQEYEGFYTWQGDSVQFGVYIGSGDEYIALGEANTTFTEIGIAKTNSGNQVYRFSAQDSSKHKTGLLNDGEDYELGIEVNGTRTVYELSMPWNSLLPDGVNPKANSRLGFSFLVNDNDGQGRRGAILFAGGIFFNKDSSQFTYINLIGKN